MQAGKVFSIEVRLKTNIVYKNRKLFGQEQQQSGKLDSPEPREKNSPPPACFYC